VSEIVTESPPVAVRPSHEPEHRYTAVVQHRMTRCVSCRHRTACSEPALMRSLPLLLPPPSPPPPPPSSVRQAVVDFEQTHAFQYAPPPYLLAPALRRRPSPHQQIHEPRSRPRQLQHVLRVAPHPRGHKSRCRHIHCNEVRRRHRAYQNCTIYVTSCFSEPLPVGISSFGLFFAGVGGQSEVEVGIAQHDAEFKWLLKKSADGTCGLLHQLHIGAQLHFVSRVVVSISFVGHTTKTQAPPPPSPPPPPLRYHRCQQRCRTKLLGYWQVRRRAAQAARKRWLLQNNALSFSPPRSSHTATACPTAHHTLRPHAPPLITRCDRRQVDTWAAHEPGDVVRLTVERQHFEGAEDDDSTAAYLSFDDLLSAGIQSALWHLLTCLRCD
jgi:hypothetical protein